MKIRFVVLIICLVVVCGCAKKASSNDKDVMRIGIFTTGPINDKSYNQVITDSCNAFVRTHNATVKNYPLTSSSHDAITETFNLANADKINVIILPGYVFTRAVIYLATKNPETKFICIDITAESIKSFAPDSWKLSGRFPQNIYCCQYAEEIAGFLAGYAAVKEGYTHLGFVGGKSVPAVIEYGCGFLQGIELATKESDNDSEIVVDYAYSKGFDASQSITESVSQWYKSGVQVIFACGGAVWMSVSEAAASFGGKVIGVDVDQSPAINAFGDGMCLTSAIKNIGKTVEILLSAINDKTFDENFGGKSQLLGLVSATDVSSNYVGLPTENWSMNKFTLSDYQKLVAQIYNNKVKVKKNIDEKTQFDFKLKMHSNLK